MRVFITGATGFAGRHLINALPSPEFAVYGSSFPLPPHPSEKNIFFLDLRSERDVFEVIRVVQPQWIFHLAAVSNVSHSWERRRETMETNVMGTFYLFEAAKKFVPDVRILYVSSSDVYGFIPKGENPVEKAFSEEDPFHLVNPYALSKVAGELLGGFYSEIENLDVVIARPFPHTGPGQSPDFVCSDWARQVIQIERGAQEPVMRVGNLDIKRDFTDVRDTLRAYILLMQKGRRGEVYNICRGEGVSLRKILEMLLASSSKSVMVEQDPAKMRKADIPFLVGDNRKIKKETSWKPQIQLEETLLELLDYWRVHP
jgi:GDP-4-dehydro-6-deoxy-D-mannose reductase